MATLQHTLGYTLFGARRNEPLVATVGHDYGTHPVGFQFKVTRQPNIDKQVDSLIALGVTQLDYPSGFSF